VSTELRVRAFVNNLLTPAVTIPQPDGLRQSRMLAGLLAIIIIQGIIFEGLILVFGHYDFISGNLPALLALGVVVLAFFLNRSGRSIIAIWIAIGMISLAIFWLTFFSYGTPIDLGFLAFLFIPLMISSTFLPLNMILVLDAIYLVGMCAAALFFPGITFIDIIIGPVVFLALASALIYIITRHRDELEKDRQRNLVQAYDATLEGWARALELRDKETQGHSQRVTNLSVRMGRSLGLDEDELVQLYRGALIHDIGKMGMPDSILLKPSPLNEEEWKEMKKHPLYAREMLAKVPFLKVSLDVPYLHHERWNGSGYPLGLKGTEIPLSARIFAAVDIWDAITSDRPYHTRLSKEEAIAYLRSQAGILLDPHIVAILISHLTDQPVA
jgi:hypothetical protein